jgi:hypothetical protein
MKFSVVVSGTECGVGVKVRPIEGIRGVDYLDSTAATKQVSYVFGPLIRNLADVGYENSKNLIAAPVCMKFISQHLIIFSVRLAIVS